MQKSIELNKQNIDYTLKVSNRAKRMRLSVHYDGSCVVTIPQEFPETLIEKFLIAKSRWVIDKINYFRSQPFIPRRTSSRSDFKKYKNEAHRLALRRLAYWNTFYGYSWNKVTIRNQKSRWGSCSKAGNLNFNYKIALLPEKMADYIIVHELCHLGEFNHSKNFWNLVAKTVPDYREIRSELKREGIKL